MQKLLATGKTDLLTGFISRKGRPFKAFLALKDKKVVFEFLPRKSKPQKPASGGRNRQNQSTKKKGVKASGNADNDNLRAGRPAGG
jgi:DNA topoisomerase-3